jgi:hypothetical protein
MAGTSTGTWSAVGITNWYTDVGRTVPAVSAPTSADNVVFDAASDNGTTFNVTLGVGAVCRDITVSNLDFGMTLTHSNPWVVHGSLSFPATLLTRAGFNIITFAATGAATISTNGYNLDNAVTFNGVGGVWQLLSDFGTNNPARTNSTVTLTNGTINLNNFVLYAVQFASSNSNARTVAFGTGRISIYGNSVNAWSVATATNFTYTGTPNVYATYSGSTGGRNLNHGTSSGGTEANTPDFYITAGTDLISCFAARNIDFTGFSGTLIGSAHNIYGNVTLSTGMTVGASASTWTFASTNATPRTITSNGKTISQPVTFNGVGGSWSFVDAFAVAATYTVTLTNGTLNGNGQAVSLSAFALGAGTKTLTLGSGTWTVFGSGTAWNANTNVTNLTVSASTGTISMTSASAKTFAGGAKTWPTLNQGGAGALTIQQSNTFANITNTVQPATVTLTSGTTQTVSAFSLAGTAGNLITLNSSSTGVQATLSDSSGVNSVSFVSIKDINATGGAVWNAYSSSGNIDAGNNTGWDFNDLLFRYIYTRRKNKVIFPI